MYIYTDKTGTVSVFAECLHKVQEHPEVTGILVLACDNNDFYRHIDQVNDILTALLLPIFGGIFPQIIHGLQRFSSGTIVAGFTQDVSVHFVPELSEKASTTMR